MTSIILVKPLWEILLVKGKVERFIKTREDMKVTDARILVAAENLAIYRQLGSN